MLLVSQMIARAIELYPEYTFTKVKEEAIDALHDALKQGREGRSIWTMQNSS